MSVLQQSKTSREDLPVVLYWIPEVVLELAASAGEKKRLNRRGDMTYVYSYIKLLQDEIPKLTSALYSQKSFNPCQNYYKETFSQDWLKVIQTQAEEGEKLKIWVMYENSCCISGLITEQLHLYSLKHLFNLLKSLFNTLYYCLQVMWENTFLTSFLYYKERSLKTYLFFLAVNGGFIVASRYLRTALYLKTAYIKYAFSFETHYIRSHRKTEILEDK